MIARIFASIVFTSALLGHVGPGAAASAAPVVQAARPLQRFERLLRGGYSAPTTLSAMPAVSVELPGLEVQRQRRGYRAIDVHPAAARLRSTAFAATEIPIPIAPNRPVVPADPDFFGFAGLTHRDERNAGTGAYVNTQFSLEPPDQGLCAGNGYVVDAVNDAVSVYSSFGTRLTAPTALSQFFGLVPEINRSTKVYGPFLSDPKCYFDRDTQRWFLTELEIDVDPVTGNDLNHSKVFLAVSQSADPTRSYRVYAFDSTDAANPGCPCFGDQPLLGADANGLFISTNEYSITGSAFNGSQIYAISKRALASRGVPTIVHIDAGALPTPDFGGVWYSIQPAAAPNTAVESRTGGGTEYFLSALDFFSTADNRIAVWAVTNTRSLRNPQPNIGLQHVVINSVAYATPPAGARQKAGPTKLGSALSAPLETINTNDDRMNQVVYAAGRLWSGVNTAVRYGRTVNAGIAFFAVAPAFNSSGFLTAKIEQQGYVAVAGQNVIFPSIGVNPSGGAVMAATLTGPDYYPSAVYVTQDGKVHLADVGAGPEDGFTGYAHYGGNGIARWGDYSAAVADLDGSIWIAAEYIPGGPRTPLANWGTFIGHVQIHR